MKTAEYVVQNYKDANVAFSLTATIGSGIILLRDTFFSKVTPYHVESLGMNEEQFAKVVLFARTQGWKV